MSTDRPIVLFDLFGVIARHQRPGAMGEMAGLSGAPTDAFTTAYWTFRQPYDAGQWTAPQYWTTVLDSLSLTAGPDTIEKLRLADIAGWSRVDDRMVAYAQSLRERAEVALLSNIPADHADAFLTAQPWVRHLDHVTFSGKIKAAKPDPAAFRHCVVAMHAAPADFLFIDDRDENVRAAQATGMNGHVFTGREELARALDTWLPTPGCRHPDPTPSSGGQGRDTRHEPGGSKSWPKSGRHPGYSSWSPRG